jgi:hypothetical protein
MITSLTSRRVSANLNTVYDYIETCKLPNRDNTYMSLIKGVRRLHNKVCKDGDFLTGI